MCYRSHRGTSTYTEPPRWKLAEVHVYVTIQPFSLPTRPPVFSSFPCLSLHHFTLSLPLDTHPSHLHLPVIHVPHSLKSPTLTPLPLLQPPSLNGEGGWKEARTPSPHLSSTVHPPFKHPRLHFIRSYSPYSLPSHALSSTFIHSASHTHPIPPYLVIQSNPHLTSSPSPFRIFIQYNRFCTNILICPAHPTDSHQISLLVPFAISLHPTMDTVSSLGILTK